MSRRKRNRLQGILLVLIALAFGFGALQLMLLRFSAGDVYPAYSTYRADPLGAKAIYEALASTDRLNVSRNLRPITNTTDLSGSTVVFLGLYPDALEEVEKEAIDTLTLYAQQGSRTVLMFNPGVSESTSPFRKDIDRRKDEEDDTPASPEARESTEAPEAPVVQEAPDAPSPPPAPIPPPAEDTGEKADEKAAEDEGKPEREPYDPYEKLHVEFYKENGLTLGKKEEWEFGGAGKATLDSEYTGGDELPESIPWHGRYYFKETGPEWRTVYTADGLPVIIEKPVDDGTFVLATDSYLLSNEALLNDRQPGFLAWVVGNNLRVVFDEVHQGVAERPGVASLARKYKLHGLFAGFIALALLFVWKNASSLVPPAAHGAAQGGQEAQTGRTASEAVVSLLRRNVPPGKVVDTCFREWVKSHPTKRKTHREQLRRAHGLVKSATGKTIVKTYNTITNILSERKPL